VSILEEIQKIQHRQARKEQLAEQRSEAYLSRVRQLAETVKHPKPGKPQEDCSAESEMRTLYNSLKKNYLRKDVNKFAFGTEMSRSSKAQWGRVVKAQQESNKDPETYLKAQFAYFDRCFRTYPKIQQLATDQAIERANVFEVELTKGSPVASALEYKTDKATEFKLADRMVTSVMRAQGLSREEVYRKLVLPGHLYISPDYLKNDPVYSKVVKDD